MWEVWSGLEDLNSQTDFEMTLAETLRAHEKDFRAIRTSTAMITEIHIAISCKKMWLVGKKYLICIFYLNFKLLFHAYVGKPLLLLS